MTILIIGAGPGGLIAALHLHRLGHDVRVFESVPAICPLGVGLNLLPHAVRELTILGLAGELAAISIPTAELAYHNKHGQLIWREPRGLDAGYRWPQFSVHRGRLQMLLLDAVVKALGPEKVRAGMHLDSFAQDVSGVKWVVYQGGEGTEPVWTTRLDSPQGAAQLAITGAGTDDDFRTLAIATQTQPPLTAKR